MPSLENWDGGLKIFKMVNQLSPHTQVTHSNTQMYMYMYSTGQKKVNVSTVRYAPGVLLVRSRFALGTLLVRSSSVCGVVRCGSVWLVRYGPPIIGYVRMRDHVRA